MAVSGGSQQLRLYRRGRAQGLDQKHAAVWAGITLAEAKLTDAEDARNPPQPEALELLNTEPRATGPRGEDEQRPDEDTNMAQPNKQDDGVEDSGGGEIKPMDVALALRLIRTEIKPAGSKVGEHSQEMSTAYKAIKKQANMNPQAVRLAVRIDDMEEAAREHWLRSFRAILSGLNIFIPRDLVDVAEGRTEEGMSAVPMSEREPATLHTLSQAAE